MPLHDNQAPTSMPATPINTARPLSFLNSSGETAPAFGLLRINSIQLKNGQVQYVIGKPTTTFWGLYLVNGAIDVPDGKPGMCTLDGPCQAIYDSGTPAIIETWGPK